MILITSAAEVQGDLRSELGPIPPAFLPIGNRNLLYWQLNLLNSEFPGEQIVLSLPEDYTLAPIQQKVIDSTTVEIVRVPRKFSLASSVLFVLNVFQTGDDTVRILHGDTLLSSFPKETDVIGLAGSTDSYDWQLAEDPADESNSIWCGYFAFSNHRALVRALALYSSNFVEAVMEYGRQIPLSNVFVEGWLDLGHLNTYFQAREKFTTQRSFNNLKIENGVVRKSGSQVQKLANEARWFAGLPFEFKKFTPALYNFDEEDGSYLLEYLPDIPLNELFVHGEQPQNFWREIFRMVGKWFVEAKSFAEQSDVDLTKSRFNLVVTKTRDRVSQFREQTGLCLSKPLTVNGASLPSVEYIVDDLIEKALQYPVHPGLMHGDLCFSNTLYDSRNRRIRLLDPRGVASRKNGSHIGDLTYDLAKFAHSAYGFYDIILAGGFNVSYDLENLDFNLELDTSPTHLAIQQLFEDEGLATSGFSDIRYALPQMILLFLSMVPLHADSVERQWALFVNGLRLYSELKGDL